MVKTRNYCYDKFSPKLHENEKILAGEAGGGGGGDSCLASHLDRPTIFFHKIIVGCLFV